MFNLAGFLIGLVIGTLSGAAFVLLLLVAMGRLPGALQSPLVAIPQILAIPTSMFGGSWAVSRVLKDVPWPDLFGSYIIGVVITFLLVIAVPLAKAVKACCVLLAMEPRSDPPADPREED